MSTQTWSELSADAWDVAPRLLGAVLTRETNDLAISGRIVEVEAYDQTDTASHSYNGQTARNSVMFGPPGFLYVYFTYGMHYCMNIVTGRPGHGSAVLVRALEPIDNIERMRQNRGDKPDLELTNGPAKLCQALAVTRTLNGHDLTKPPLTLMLAPKLNPSQIVTTTRIGISRAQDQLWRFYIKDNAYVSKP
jgi:DNA-3-methyladenine glycosylase